MIFSMTGFSAANVELESGSLSLEIRSVNHRFLDIQIRIPENLRTFETAMRERLSANLSRGKVECRVSYNIRTSNNIPSRLNLPLLRQLAQWNKDVRDIFPSARDLSVADILHWNGVLENSAIAADQLHENLMDLLQKSILEFNSARAREGERLKEFIMQRVKKITALRIDITPRVPAAIKAYEIKLKSRLLEALGNHDDERLHQEIAIFASKIDVDEELSRLHAHLTEAERVLENGGCVGKRLDFLMQELHREANTLGSKSVDAEVSRASMEMKVLIEQMREQIQNLE